MEREVFVIPDGESFFASNVEFGPFERHRETRQGTLYGTTRQIIWRFTVETAQVSFRLPLGAIREGVRGQLSTSGDKFFEVTVVSLEAKDDHLLVLGEARRTFDHECDR